MTVSTGQNVGIGTTSPSVSGLEISRATGVSPTPVELRLTTTTNDSGWSTTNPWGRLSFYSADASVGGAKVHASIQTTAQSSAGGNSNLDFFVTDTANGTLFRTLSFQGAGTNTTQTLFYSGGGTNTMTLTTNGDLALGTTTPTTDSISFVRGSGKNAILELAGNGNPPNNAGAGTCFSLLQATDNNAYIYNRANAPMVFGTNNTERARIGASGGLAIVNGLAVGTSTIFTSSIFFASAVLSAGAGSFPLRWNSSTGIVTYDTSSRFVKENIEDSPYGLAEVMQLQPRKYFRVDDQKFEIGFVADEIQPILPEFVPIIQKSTFTKNEEDIEAIAGGVNYEKLTAVLVKAIQELKAELDATKAEVAALKGAAQ
jgi:hypothetical protein